MKVHALKADMSGSGFYRIDEPTRAAALLGVDIVSSADIDVRARSAPSGRVDVLEVMTDVDVLVIQRPLSQRVNALAEAAKAQGIAVVVELDDDFHNVHPDNVAYPAIDPVLDPLHNRNWLNATIGIADLLTVSAPALLKYVPRGKTGVVIRNYLPERALELANPERPDTVGWTGTMRTHPKDVSRAFGALSQARPDVPLHVVGDSAGVGRALGAGDREVTRTPWLNSVDDYWRAIASGIGVGLAPLEPSKFNRSKSWLKVAEYATLGVPFVASPSPEYIAFTEQAGVGYLARSSSSWARGVAQLLEDPGDWPEAGRQWAKENTLELHAHEWVQAWQTAMEKR